MKYIIYATKRAFEEEKITRDVKDIILNKRYINRDLNVKYKYISEDQTLVSVNHITEKQEDYTLRAIFHLEERKELAFVG